MFLTVLFYIFIAVIFLEFVYFGFATYYFSKISKPCKKSNAAISLILYTKNQAEVLKKQLPVFLEQKHTNFELVLINHASTDDTLEVMKKFQRKNPKLKIIDVKNNESFWASKKYALTLGIKAATHEQLVLSSIDMQPKSASWLQYMAAASQEKPMVIGFQSYPFTKFNFFYQFFGFMSLLKNYTLGKLGIQFHGTSANVSYSKTLFFSTNGFVQHMNLPFGATELFLNEVAQSTNTTFFWHKDAGVEAIQKPSFSSWFRKQLKNELTLRSCKPSVQIANALLFFCRLGFYALAPVLLIYPTELHPLILLLIISRFVVQYISFGLIAKKVNKLKLIIALPLLELWHLGTQFIIFISSLKSKRLYWN